MKKISIGQKVIDDEINGLSLLRDSLNSEFEKAVDLILSIEGRLILTGMGKSGHVARKIASTFSSTGTPAYFVHPAEASHGDLGMVTEKDLVLAISNSGETSELFDIIHHCNSLDIPVISITSKQYSTLGEFSDIVLLLPAVNEACPYGLAPTTSTTMSLALGDALAISSYKHMDEGNFFRVHPGGNLGELLKKR